MANHIWSLLLTNAPRLAKLQDKDIRAFNPDKSKISSWPASTSAYDVKEMSDFGFTPNASPFKGGSDEAKKMLKKFLTVIDDYKESRDYPILEKPLCYIYPHTFWNDKYKRAYA